MRIFNTYTFNIIDKVKFNKTVPYIENMLKELGLEYKNIAFYLFSVYGDTIDKAIKKYPCMSKYRFPNEYGFENLDVLTSMRPGWTSGDIFAEKEDIPAIFEIFSKIPRGLNFSFPELVFNGINWYNGIDMDMYIPSDTDDSNITKYNTVPFSGNTIHIDRSYDDGNKINTVTVSIYAGSSDAPRDTSGIVKKLEPYFGTPEYSSHICRFSAEETRQHKKYAIECHKELDSRISAFLEDIGNKPQTDIGIEYVYNLADKKKLKKAFKNTDFKAVSNNRAQGLLPGMNLLECYDEHNHKFRLMFDRTQSSPDYFYFYIEVWAHNFRLFSNQHTFYAKSEEESEKLLEKTADFCMRFKKDFGDRLYKYFGDTPDWYVNK